MIRPNFHPLVGLLLLALFHLFEPLSGSSQAHAQGDDGAWPMAIEHKFGSTVIPATPKRVVSLSYVGHDFLLALGVQPVAVRHWFGDHPRGVWPWAEALLGENKPVILRGEIDLEQVAMLQPDLIVGQWSGMTEEQYRFLSQIAPTLPPAQGQQDYDMPWQDMLARLGQATGRSHKADMIQQRLTARIDAIRASHPDWQGKTAAIVWPAQMITFTSRDLRSRLVRDLGLTIPKAIDAMASGTQFYVTLPSEDISAIDADLLIWVGSKDAPSALKKMLMRPTLQAVREGREIYADETLAAALSHSSPLSLDYALDHLVPQIEAAIDGEPATIVPSMQAIGLVDGS